MIIREVKLLSGVKLGETRHTAATIREETLDDELAVLEEGAGDMQLKHRRIMMRRVIRLGELDKPNPALLRKLTRVDWDLIETAMVAMDEELEAEAKALSGSTGGRSEPGGGAPGDV
ncbi:MAG: hypothetical protein AAF568_08905 [Pseudomonadota bacterium]